MIRRSNASLPNSAMRRDRLMQINRYAALSASGLSG
jgi:hypothetical protein